MNILKKIFIVLALIISAMNVHAQISILQKAIDKIENSKNFSYKQILKTVGSGNSDTMTYNGNSTFMPAPKDSNYKYFFKIDFGQMTFEYNGQSVVTNINSADSSYSFIQPHKYSLIYTLPFFVNQAKKVLAKLNIVVQTGDTVINSIPYCHFIEKDIDSVNNDNKDYLHTHWFIDKQSDNIMAIIYTWQYTSANKTVMRNYMEINYSIFKFNQDNINLSLNIPANFHQAKEQTDTLLKVGTIAPDWTLYSTDGNKLALSEQRGKVVLVDFSYIGCLPCMEAIKPMNNLHEKFKSKDVEIVSIFPIDKKASVEKYIKEYGIKFPIYMDTNTLPAKYQITGYPCFYFIDKDGKIANVFTGVPDDFETKTSSIIDNLLNKN